MDYEEKCKTLFRQIDDFRKMIKLDKFDTIIEPLQFLISDTDDAQVKIQTIDDLKLWQKELSYSFLVKTNTIEDAILYFINIGDIYTASILIRHHMEQCGYITLSMEKLLEFINSESLEIIEKFIAKTLFGSPLNNNKKFKYLPENFSTTRTPNIVSFINALDRFMEKMIKGINKNFFSKNYSALNHFAHPSSLSSTFFIDSREIVNGHEIKFRYKQDALGFMGKYNSLRLLIQNIMVGYSSYYIFNSIEFTKDGLKQNMDTLKFCYQNIIEKIKVLIKQGDFA